MRLFIAAAALAIAAAPAHAAFTTIDISSYVNSNIGINASTFPTGTTSGNRGTGVPFNVAVFNGAAGTWNPDFVPPNTGIGSPIVGVSLTVPLTSLNISGQASFYALLNNYFGTPGADEYDITITATNGDHMTYQSIGGVDTRDYNAAVYSNTIANSTHEWYNNGIGQRFDVREFKLPALFATDTIASFTITQVTYGAFGDAALFSGLTFSDQVAKPLPEPASVAVVGLGLAGLALARRRRG